ncbi:low molecular weight protein-tyrosine-phosphatase [Planobacterium oryzisoli]|uniref:protein-tyrosine-phosphatase n=1 Tax=Planobacterium oryzisoli TaxID=2771435 RepID=A0A930YTV9_9FLAO|nr:low molecular weight protein-tyrosine-phosphatase [Planobacterium oryzisoli]MBF5026277.1 low molecular weight phosphotyrosine protein phosphatase [Planobacterium oryzisoli]
MKILTVCLGNICRSPLAELIMKESLGSDFHVESRGTIGIHQGRSADRRSVAIAQDNGLDLQPHRAKMLTTEDLENFDLILCMDHSNLADVHSLCASEQMRRKVRLISPDNLPVPDPYYGNREDFERVWQLLQDAAKHWSHTLNNM